MSSTKTDKSKVFCGTFERRNHTSSLKNSHAFSASLNVFNALITQANCLSKALPALVILTSFCCMTPAEAKSLNQLETFQNQLMPTTTGGSSDSPNEYFTIDEAKPGSLMNAGSGFNSPLALAKQMMVDTANSNNARGLPPAVTLTRWVKHESAPPAPNVKYQRKFHFGTWINDPTDNTCHNSRAKVLIRDSKTPVTFKANNRCVVDTGTWDDPYTGNRYYSTKDIQIDHVVPLHHAYQTGAWKWDYRSRCIYGNFMANKYHLLSVNGHENMAKGDKSPDAYIPPNRRVTCDYLQAWLQIKLAWGLVMFPHEATAIQNLYKSNNCDSTQFSMNRDELSRQRKAMSEAIQVCQNPPAPPTTTPTTTASN